MIKYAQDFYAFIAKHRNTMLRSDSRKKYGPFEERPRTITPLRMVRRYRKGRKVQVMA